MLPKKVLRGGPFDGRTLTHLIKEQIPFVIGGQSLLGDSELLIWNDAENQTAVYLQAKPQPSVWRFQRTDPTPPPNLHLLEEAA